MSDRRRVTFRWDLDKTYLNTEFDSLRGLVRIPFESAEDKVAAPGVAALIRGLRSAAELRRVEVRIRFVSGSPPQVGKAILGKLALDRVVHDGVTFKDQWGRIRRGKFRDLREQVGYKLTELLRDRRDEPPGTEEYLFGDDWESDPLIYSLYADVVSGEIDRRELAEILDELGVDPELRDVADVLAARVPKEQIVRRVFINLARATPPARFRPYGERLVPSFNYLQTAACLFDEGVLDEDGVAEVVAAMRSEGGYDSRRLVNSLRDIERRGHLSEAGAAVLVDRLAKNAALPQSRAGRSRWRDGWLRLRRRVFDGVARVAPRRADYLSLIPALADRMARLERAEEQA